MQVGRLFKNVLQQKFIAPMKLLNYIAHAYTPLNVIREAIGHGFFWHFTSYSYINFKCQKISKVR